MGATSREPFLSGPHPSYYFYSRNPDSDSQIADQIKVLSKDFTSAKISWVLAGITRTVNREWFETGPKLPQQTKMKTKLRKGGAADLDVYSVGFVFQ